MATARLEVVRLLAGVTNPHPGVKMQFVTQTLDLRTNVERIESVIARGVSVDSQPSYFVSWIGGVTTSEIMGTPTGDIDAFEALDSEQNPIPGTDGNENWLAGPMPAVIWPYIRFVLTASAGSPADSQFWLYAMLRRHFGS